MNVSLTGKILPVYTILHIKRSVMTPLKALFPGMHPENSARYYCINKGVFLLWQHCCYI